MNGYEGLIFIDREQALQSENNSNQSLHILHSRNLQSVLLEGGRLKSLNDRFGTVNIASGKIYRNCKYDIGFH